MRRLTLLPALLLALGALALPAAAAAGDYTYQFSFGSAGSGDGQFGRVMGMFYEPTGGHLYVADWTNGRIVEYDREGNFVANRGTYGTGPGTISNPNDIAMGSSGMWVSDDYAPKIIDIGITSSPHELVLGNANPAGLALDADGSVWVCTTLGVQHYSTGTLELIGSIPGSYADIAIGPTGHLFCTDYAGDRIVEYAHDGTYVGAVATTGSAPGQVDGPWGIAIVNEGIVVGDDGNDRVQILGSAQKVLPDPPDLGGFRYPDAIAAGGGRIYVCDENVIRCYATPTKITPVLTKSPTGASYTLTRKAGVAFFTYRVTVRKPGGAVIAGKTVKLQKSLNGTKWTTKYSLVTSAVGKAVKKLTFTARGTTYWRWYSPSTAQYTAASARRTRIIVR